MRIFASHPMGNANSRQAMLALAEGNLLELFLTSIALFDDSPLAFLARVPGCSELLRRRFPNELRPLTQCHPLREAMRLISQRLGWRNFLNHEKGWASVDQVFRNMDHRLSRAIFRKNPDAVYCYEDGALESFRAAKATGAKCILDHPVAHWRCVRRILEEERELLPAWADTMTGLHDSAEKLARKDEELFSSDKIIVASTFSKKSLQECPFPLPPVTVIPYGAPAIRSPKNRKPQEVGNAPLKILFVGGLGQLKGIAYLLEALKIFGHPHSLTLIGRLPSRDCVPLNEALQKYRWIPSLPHDQILEEMGRHDVFVFPSLSEGFGMVLTEALSQGLPIITTPNTCGPDIINDGVEGFIVKIRDSSSIAEKLELLHRDRSRLLAMSEAAEKKAMEMKWAIYRTALLHEVQKTVGLQG